MVMPSGAAVVYAIFMDQISDDPDVPGVASNATVARRNHGTPERRNANRIRVPINCIKVRCTAFRRNLVTRGSPGGGFVLGRRSAGAASSAGSPLPEPRSFRPLFKPEALACLALRASFQFFTFALTVKYASGTILGALPLRTSQIPLTRERTASVPDIRERVPDCPEHGGVL